MQTQSGLKAIILVTEFNQSVVVEETSGNINFIEDIKNYNGYVEDIFYEMETPTEKGFYEFNGQADVSTDINGHIDEVNYSGEFVKVDEFKFKQ